MKKLMLGCLVAGASSLNAPAHASLVRADCVYEWTTGVVYGYAGFDDQGTHSIKCYGYGYETPSGTGQGFITTAGWVGLARVEATDVCTEIDGVTVDCHPAIRLTAGPRHDTGGPPR
jgi:hypothetical protein